MSEQLKYKMYNHEVIPPGDVWNAIQKDLDGQVSAGSLAEKMHAYEVAPPEGAWQQIVSKLDIKKIPVRNISGGSPLRWVAAAAVFLFLVTGAYYFLDSGETAGDRTASAGNATNPDQPVKTVPLAANQPVEKTKASAIDLHANTTERRTAAIQRKRPLHSSPVKDANLVDADDVVIPARQILGESGEPIRDMSVVNPSNDKYVSITAPNGQQTKISSKLAIAMPYLGFLTSDGQSISENHWKLLIEEWRARIMQSGFVPSSGNFLDILEFSELIKD